MSRTLLLSLFTLAAASSAFGQSLKAGETAALLQNLSTQGISAGRVMGIDARGIPLVCGTVAVDTLEAGRRSWECIPSVIRADGIDAFYLEVNANGPVNGVTIPDPVACLVPPYAGPLVLLDNGTAGDRVAGDRIYTIGPFKHNLACALSEYYFQDPDSPAGLDVETVGDVVVEETDTSLSSFLLWPQVGLLRSDIPAVATTALAPDIVVSEHLINIRGTRGATQNFMRGGINHLATLCKRMYQVIPDAIDLLVFFSTYKIERLPRLSGPNFTAGVHSTVIVDYTGSTNLVSDISALYGSHGVLLGINVLDAFDRGATSNNAMHEITHQWSAAIDNSFGLTEGAHYKPSSSAASLVGGQEWIELGGGQFRLNCEEGRNGAHHAPRIDKYMAGFIINPGPSYVLHQNDALSSPLFFCDSIITSANNVTISAIQVVHGVRTPGPGLARRSFDVAFVAESCSRMLNPTEMTYYDILAGHFAKPIPAESPDPYLGFNWVPIERYWGEGTTWRTRIVTTPTHVLDNAIPTRSRLLPNVPNPFNPMTRIAFDLDGSGSATLRILDVSGSVVRTLIDGSLAPGRHMCTWDGWDDRGRPSPSGVYLYHLQAGTTSESRRMVLLR